VRVLSLAGIACAWLAMASPALGAQRYAAPGEVDTSPCTQVNPCNVESAVENAVANVDEVIIAPGTYVVGDPVIVVAGTNVHGEAGQARPVITSTQPITVGGDVGTGTTRVSHLEIVNTGAGAAFGLTDGIAEDIIARTNASLACNINTSTIRDSVCWSTGASGIAVRNEFAGVANLRNVTAIASGTSSTAIYAVSFGPGAGPVEVDARNVIARGTSFDVTAESDNDNLEDSATVTLHHSNFSVGSEVGVNASVTSATTNNNQETAPLFVDAANGNFHQTAASPTIDAGTSSATLLGTFDFDGDARATDGNCNGTAEPDIGADELPDADGDTDADACDNCPATANPSQANHDGDGQGNECDADDDNDGVLDGPDNCETGASAGTDTDGDGCKDAGEDADDDNDTVTDGFDNCALVANANQQDSDADGQGDACDATPLPPAPDPGPGTDTTAPDTTITENPPARSKSKTATFAFTGTDARVVASFECKRDAASFEPCTSPLTTKVGKGKHSFQVRAIDAAGNVDPTPASVDWKVKPKKKKKK
jgi:Thrombospondin type 3 repeat